MKLSTRAQYGIRASLELACNYGKGPLQIKIIAQKQEISVKYLEQIMAILRSAGFVRSFRGAKGGYVLTKPPNQVKISDLFNALEGPIVTVECLESDQYCARAADCVARELWSQVQQAIIGVLESVTLEDLVERVKSDKTSSYQI